MLRVGKSYQITIEKVEEVTVNDEWAPKLGDPVVTIRAVWRSIFLGGDEIDRFEVLFVSYLSGDDRKVALVDDRGRVLIRDRELIFKGVDAAEKFVDRENPYGFAEKWGL